MKKFVLFVVMVTVLFCVFGARFHTVPTDDYAYRIIRSAELRGIIPLQSDVKPYSFDAVASLLETVAESDMLSANEKGTVNSVLTRLETKYGTQTDNRFPEVLRYGSLGLENSLGSLKAGVAFFSVNRGGFNLDKDRLFTSRNLLSAYVMGDIKDFLSYDVNMSFVLDKLDLNAYSLVDFDFTSDGQYFVGTLNETYNLSGKEGLGLGLSSSSEIAAGIFGGKLGLRAGSFERNWGSGTDGLGLAGAATKFEGAEIQLVPCDWFTYSFLIGSLGLSCFKTAYDVALPASDGKTDNNFSIHRAELSFGNFKFNFFEAVVWKKRPELSYMNPVSVYWVAQNYLGDWDALIGGFDFSYRIPGSMRIYLNFAVDEFTADLAHLFTNPRNIVAIQGGIEAPSSVGDFGLMTLQFTYIPPFFGSHYDVSREAWGQGRSAVNYANGGKTLSYPLNPDSFEILFSYSCSLGRGWSVSGTVKDQMQSAQYTLREAYNADTDGYYLNAGLSVNDCMVYELDSQYASKSLFRNIWKNTLNFDFAFEKVFDDLPLSLSVGLNGIADWTRNFSAKTGTDGPGDSNGGRYNLGYDTEYGQWNMPSLRILGKLGFKVYY